MLTPTKTLLPFSALALALACGGGGSSSTNPGVITTTTLSFKVNGPVSWVAFQDGSGSWTPLTLSAGSATPTVHDPAGRYGIAVGYTEGTYTATRIWQGTLAEMPAIAFTVAGSEPVTLSASVTGLSASENAFGYFGRSNSGTGNNAGFTDNVEPGKADLVVLATDSGTGNVNRALIQRGRTYSASTVLPSLDLGSAPSLVSVPVAVSGATGFTYLGGDWYTANGTYAALSFPSSSSTAIQVIPASAMATGDVQDVYAGDSTSSSIRLASVTFASTSSVSITLPNVFTGGVSGGSGSPLMAQWVPFPNTRFYSGNLRQTAANIRKYVTLTTGWVGGGSTPGYVFPDFQSIAAGYEFVTGQSVTWFFGPGGSSYDPKTLTQPQPFKVGDTDWISWNHGTFIPMIGGGTPKPVQASSDPLSAEEVRTFARSLRGR